MNTRTVWWVTVMIGFMGWIAPTLHARSSHASAQVVIIIPERSNRNPAAPSRASSMAAGQPAASSAATSAHAAPPAPRPARVPVVITTVQQHRGRPTTLHTRVESL